MTERVYQTLIERLQTAHGRSSLKRIGFVAAAILAVIFAVAAVYLGVIHSPSG
ncbi:MAG: hypothetical protein K8F92_08770 [Hyphomicrobium sp.]|uniref:hypothetical protein n=1 Tax=Hyphomicrobium sp. TaxID=82 RepID=UPI0025BA4278|nr:hypothetical protein [Hyphomicrobium sp.]MBZ0209735.1 hypothetical protein [Hyphomicrobium sp.]